MLPRSTSDWLLPKASRRMLKRGPVKRLPVSIWFLKKACSCWPSSIFSISSRVAMSRAMPSPMPEATTVPCQERSSWFMDSMRPGVSLSRWRKLKKLES